MMGWYGMSEGAEGYARPLGGEKLRDLPSWSHHHCDFCLEDTQRCCQPASAIYLGSRLSLHSLPFDNLGPLFSHPNANRVCQQELFLKEQSQEPALSDAGMVGKLRPS